MKSFLKELRDAAARCPDLLVSKMCRDIADEIHARVLSLSVCPSHDTMRQLNAAWVRAVNVLAKATPTPGDNPRSGAGEVEQERLAA